MLFESMLYAIGIAYVTLVMVKERAELNFKAAAFSDVLTGIGNRRAFMLHFACLLADTDEQGAVQVAERIRQRFAELDLLAPGFLSVSIGVVTSTAACHDLSRLLSQADQALYRAKDQGRNRVQTACNTLQAIAP